VKLATFPVIKYFKNKNSITWERTHFNILWKRVE